MFSDKSFGLPKGLLDTVKNITEKKTDKDDMDLKKVGGKKTEVDTEPKTDDRIDNQLDTPPPAKNSKKNMKEAAEGTHPKTEKEKKCSSCGMNPCKCKHTKKDTKQVDESMRLVHTHSDGPHHAKVYKDTEWGEYRVKYFKNGKHLPKADSHHDDADDAHGTAKHELKRMNEGTEQVDEISVGVINRYLSKTNPEYSLPKEIEKRAAGRNLALKKKWGGGVSGTEPAKVPATEEVLSANELENLKAIAQQFDEGKQVPDRPTITGAPLRGANQDQSGFGVKNDAADYTISDEKKRK